MSNSLNLSRRTLLASSGAGLVLATTNAATGFAAAPMMGSEAAVFRRVKLGDFEITTIYDGAFQVPDAHSIFGTNVSETEVSELALDNMLPPKALEIGFTPTLINTGSEVILFDAGNGAGRRPNAGALLARLGAAGFSPEQIDVVVLTHFHFDHIGGLMEDGKPAFPNARYVAPGTEYDFWTNPDLASNDGLAGGHQLVMTNIVPLAEKTTFIKDGDDVISGITAMSAFGHTPGHTVYHVESNGQRLVITADSANHFVLSLQRPDWHVKFDMDKQNAADSRKQVFGMIAADRVPFIGYHMPFPAIGYIEAKDQGYRYVPLSYQLNL
ncbi:MAG: MBL fold metallo-hydrolase [Alphaproteobacteria bacterium]|nr:MBL fold metallo-hydrolase [Alphaproteobacteria bacterium]MAS46603.1 MBL fold metallo-hydrolase [Alphaproteobacteria bacterium]MAX94697.1 MBL fold metallo-hydrolase [Alphaproteobacteria bacterium]MBN53851.1 MBL fold metallo-hydrolase [Alphaproteobacteria bacterium]OUT41810.1 MAG: MBL fold metallo-hydrolase [Micavibrio sp. TMED2]|tara:strand:+ start:14074 stop:15051 length:978 start_codon:yes stop_codon:yes gene_type:complete